MRRHSTTMLKGIVAAALFVAACGGSTKTVKSGGGGGGGTGPAGPRIGEGTAPVAEAPREITTDARKDFEAAVDYYQKQEKGGWSEGTCHEAAERFRKVAGEHDKLLEAGYMVGRSLQNCGLDKEAEDAYKRGLQINSNCAQCLSNLGEIYFQRGKVDDARQSWEAAIKINPKVTAAYNNLAYLLLQQLRKTKEGPAWEKLEEQTRDNLSRVLAVDSDNTKAYVLYGLVYMEGYQKNRSRLDLAKLLLDEGAKRDAKYAPLHNAYGMLQLLRSNVGQALESFQKAVALDPNFVEARMNVGSITLGFRKYDTAAEQFSEVIKRDPKEYDAIIGLGIAYRGLAKLDDAEAQYNKAKDLDQKRGWAYFNLGVLYKDFRANSQADLKAAQKVYGQSRDFFKQALDKGDLTDEQKADAKDNVSDLDKLIRQLDDVIKAEAQNAASGGDSK